MLVQTLGPSFRPMAYYSTHLDIIEKGMIPSLRAIATTATMIQKSSDLVLGSKLIV